MKASDRFFRFKKRNFAPMKWTDCFSAVRFGQERVTDDTRTAYERDYDRIIFSSAFRRLQNKTQIFPLPEHRLVHNRLTHSLEVVSVGRSLASLVGTNIAQLPEVSRDEKACNFYTHQLPAVIAAACLAHDLGNPAFGHSGEKAISHYFLKQQNNVDFRAQFTAAQWADLVAFEGNANAFRLLTHSFNHRSAGGFQTTYSTLAALIKYPCESLAVAKNKGKHRSKYGYFQSDIMAFEHLQKHIPLKSDTETPRAYFRHPFVYLTEAADDICYTIVDYEDAHRLGILSYTEVKEDFLYLLKSLPNGEVERVNHRLPQYEGDKNEAVAYLRAKCINTLVQACAQVFAEKQKELITGNFKGALLDHLGEAKPALRQINTTSVKRIYNQESVLKIEMAGYTIMGGLVQQLVEAVLMPPEQRHASQRKLMALMPAQYTPQEAWSAYDKARCTLDYVSGMTDNYALELYRNLSGISLPGI